MKNCKPLGEVTQKFIPEYFDIIDWSNIWSRKLESGTAFEWAVLASLIYVAKKHNISVEIPLIDQFDAGEYFILRNEIPLSHGAQAGNSATALSSKELKYRFLYSLVPKAIFRNNDQTYSVFREGCPYHKIMCGKNYMDRTDIIIIPGAPTEDYPKFNNAETEVTYSFVQSSEQFSGVLRVRNSPLIPCKMRLPRKNLQLLTTGIIECSVNKTAEVATNQLQKYDSLFTSNNHHPALSLITGNDLSSLPYDTHQINLETEDASILFQELLASAEKMLKNFSIID